MLQERGSHAANMERWIVYTLMLQILVAIARATEDFRHILYEGKKLMEIYQMRDKKIRNTISVDFLWFIVLMFIRVIFELDS